MWGRPLWLSGQSLLDERRIGRGADVGRIIWLMWGILVGGVVKVLLGFFGHVGAEVTAWVSPSFFLAPPIPDLLLLVLAKAA